MRSRNLLGVAFRSRIGLLCGVLACGVLAGNASMRALAKTPTSRNTTTDCPACEPYSAIIEAACERGEVHFLRLLLDDVETKSMTATDKDCVRAYLNQAIETLVTESKPDRSIGAALDAEPLALADPPAANADAPKIDRPKQESPKTEKKKPAGATEGALQSGEVSKSAPAETPRDEAIAPTTKPRPSGETQQPSERRIKSGAAQESADPNRAESANAVSLALDLQSSTDDPFEARAINAAVRGTTGESDSFAPLAVATEPAATTTESDPLEAIKAAHRAAGYLIDEDSAAGVAPTALQDAQTEAPPTGAPFAATSRANSDYELPAGAASHFSSQYLRLRKRYLDLFFFEGMTATTLKLNANADLTALDDASVKTAKFADQTLHMGQAMLTFAAEAKLLKDKGLSPDGSEKVLNRILNAFDELDAADQEFYGRSVPGFFLRDLVHKDLKRGVPWDIDSDSASFRSGGDHHAPAMSLDQSASLFVGWWAVSKYSTDSANKALAVAQCRRVIDFLRDSLFFVRLPDGQSIPTSRGPEFRYAAGFFCHMAKEITGDDLLGSSSIDVTIKGDPIRFRDDNLGEFEIPEYRIPATMRVSLSHPFVVALKPAALSVMTTPRIKIPFSKLFPGVPENSTLPCAHMTTAHPSGHVNFVPCVHLTVSHPDGDLVGTLPCTHLVNVHPNDTAPCIHMRPKHSPHSVTLPCAHIGKLHGSHSKTVAGIRVSVPCTHFGPVHSGGHSNQTPCLHMTQSHPGGHSIPCVHRTAQHPAGHKQFIPCVHPTAVHSAGDPVTLPCAHMEQSHPSGHGFNLHSLDIDIPLGDKMHPYTRHIILQCFAFEPGVNGAEMVAAAVSSKHMWGALLRAQVKGDVPMVAIAAQTKEALSALPTGRGPDNKGGGPWVHSNRWERCTELPPSSDDDPEAYNGIDFLSLEVLARLNGIE